MGGKIPTFQFLFCNLAQRCFLVLRLDCLNLVQVAVGNVGLAGVDPVLALQLHFKIVWVEHVDLVLVAGTLSATVRLWLLEVLHFFNLIQI